MPKPYHKDLIVYRLKRSREFIRDAEILLNADSHYTCANRIYYAAFTVMRALLSCEGVDFRKHSAVIAYFRKNYIKTGIISIEFSDFISDAESIRNSSDYEDFYVPDKEELEKQLATAKEFIACVETVVTKKITEID